MFNKHKILAYPAEVVTTLKDLMRYEFLIGSGQLLSGHAVSTAMEGWHPAKIRGRGLDFEEVRHYVPGDDIRNIDWRVTARTGETYSKVFNEEKERPVFIVLDQSSAMFFGSQRFVKSVTAAHVTAISTFYTAKRGERVGGLVFNENDFELIMPGRSKTRIQHFLSAVAKCNAQLPLREFTIANTSLLRVMLQKTKAVLNPGHLVIIISDFLAIDEGTKQYLGGLNQYNDVLLIHIYDLLDQSLPDGKIILTDGHTQIGWDNSKKKWGKKYKESFVEIQSGLMETFSRYQLPIVFFNTAEAAEDQVLQALDKILRRQR